jgi:transcriptional regulator with XRE-family HTH domain
MNKYKSYKDKIRSDFLRDIIKPMVERRHDLKLTQEDVNFKIGVADRLVSKWECGTRTPTLFNLVCWAEALDGKIVYINNNDNTPKCMVKQACNDNQPKQPMTWKGLAELDKAS